MLNLKCLVKQFKLFDENETSKEIKVKCQLTVEYTLQQNGVAERANRTLVEMTRCILVEPGLPESIWAEAVNSAVWLRIRFPTKVLVDKTPYEVYTGRKSLVEHVRAFESKAIVPNKKPGRPKFRAKINK